MNYPDCVRAARDALASSLGEFNALVLIEYALYTTKFSRVSAPAEGTSVLPNPLTNPRWSWARIRDEVGKPPAVSPRISPSSISLLLSRLGRKDFDILALSVWPPRSKVDLSLRRTRMYDWFNLFKAHGRGSDLEWFLSNAKASWDYIFVCNLLAGLWCFGRSWFGRWLWLGALSHDLSWWISSTKVVHNIAKTFGLLDERWMDYVEASNLSGYRNLPFPGFDPVSEAQALAQGGTPRNYFGFSLDYLISKYLPLPFVRVAWVPFSDWVEKAEWVTAGSSNVGTVRLVLGSGEAIKVKARKNMVPLVYDLDSLASEASTVVPQKNVAIIKSELGKLRMAVSGDLLTYLQMTYVNWLLGGAYRAWPGSTAEETFEEQTLRMRDMLRRVDQSVSLPFDFSGFDHQPLTSELKAIVRHLCTHARLNVPPDGWLEFDRIVSSIVSGFDTATLSVFDSGIRHTFAVEGGLMSGLRWTSALGNAWNSIMTGLVFEVLECWGVPTSQISRYIRGDDSAIFTPNWASAALFELGYRLIGVEGGAGKYSIQQSGTEFLRVWYTLDGCVGYGCRAIPSLTQRKPWSSDPWTSTNVISALVDACSTLMRRIPGRLAELTQLRLSLVRSWARSLSLPMAVAFVPRVLGGAGLLPPPSASMPILSGRLPLTLPAPKLSESNVTDAYVARVQLYGVERYGIELGLDEARAVAERQLLSTLDADSIPEYAKYRRKAWNEEVRGLGLRVVSHTDITNLGTRLFVENYSDSYSDFELWWDSIKAGAPDFGSCPEVETARQDYAIYGRDLSFKEWLAAHFPKVFTKLRHFSASWHLSERLDYLGGTFSARFSRLHPSLYKVCNWLAARELRPSRNHPRLRTLVLPSLFEPGLYSSPLSRLLYLW